MLYLNHDDHVFAAGWGYPYDQTTAKVVTVRGLATKYGHDADAAEARAKERGHALAATSYTGGTLVGDRMLAQHLARQRAAQRAEAAMVQEGQLVSIDGVTYEVRVVRGNERGPRNSDPIHFVPLR